MGGADHAGNGRGVRGRLIDRGKNNECAAPKSNAAAALPVHLAQAPAPAITGPSNIAA